MCYEAILRSSFSPILRPGRSPATGLLFVPWAPSDCNRASLHHTDLTRERGSVRPVFLGADDLGRTLSTCPLPTPPLCPSWP